MAQNVGYHQHWYSPVSNLVGSLVGSTIHAINPLNYLHSQHNSATASQQGLEGTLQETSAATPSGGFHFPLKIYVAGGTLALLLAAGLAYGANAYYGGNGSTPLTDSYLTSPTPTATPTPSATKALQPTLESKIIATATPQVNNASGNYDRKATLELIREVQAAGASATPEQIKGWVNMASDLGYKSDLEYGISGDYKKADMMRRDAENFFRNILWDIALSKDPDRYVVFMETCAEIGQGHPLTAEQRSDFRDYFGKTKLGRDGVEIMLSRITPDWCVTTKSKNFVR